MDRRAALKTLAAGLVAPALGFAAEQNAAFAAGSWWTNGKCPTPTMPASSASALSIGLGKLDLGYLSTDAEVNTGRPLISAADGQRHHEIFRGRQICEPRCRC
jgi:hypothetical protein